MNAADYCAGCGQRAGACVICGGTGRLHEHVSGDWYCRACLSVAVPHLFSEPAPQHIEVYDSEPGPGGR